ncbi:McnC protein (plasmid) [Nostoc sp. NIES-3756]|uniref:non-ribosomal peptide synthetase n=1 Tax=Nostoc sp. NIES-3756 TaxID=1751286 RepID=UPI000721C1E5|nr:non-ribosomal peptide synthetase [Nostoc sp. NIES-3756]BAT56778.1 McnC protein [Nostoc sp. NIES-3756]BAY41547.1 McnC protein [Nostoc sp. NIES-2111]
MKTLELLSYLRSLDVQIFIDGEILRCNSPEGVLTAELRQEIQERKAEIINFLKAANHTNNYNFKPLVAIPRAGNPPLSFAQQRLWFLDQLLPNNPFYNVPATLHLRGWLNLAALEQTFNEIVQRHEALRTNFVMQSGQPVQIIKSQITISLSIIDLQQQPVDERETQAQQLIIQEVQKPFNLTTDSLLRVTLFQLNEAEYILLLNMHHIVSDGWSIGVLVQEIAALYTAFSSNHPSSLPQLAIQYADFAHWQRQWLQGEVLETQLVYWRKQLDNISVLNLPIDKPRSAIQRHRGARQFLELPKSLSQALLTLSQQEGVTLFMTLLAAFQILLYRYTQQDDIAVGSPIANRNRSEIEGLIGFFVNSLVLRTDLSGNPTFKELLSRVKDVALGAYAHQDLPFEKLVEELHPERSLNQNPLFQVVFALQNAPMSALELPRLTVSPWQFDSETTRFDLEFHLWGQETNNALWVDSSAGISGFVIYSTDLFEDATITRMLKHFQILLEGIVANPEQKIATLPLLSEAEIHQLLIEWNTTQVDYSQEQCIHQLFEGIVEQNPDAIALLFGEQQLSYQELNIRSNQLAHYLNNQGITNEVLVGLCVERSFEMIIGMLGILKAGGAYLPIDPNYPSERINFILKDAQVPILLTHKSLFETLENYSSQIICLDEDWQIIAQEKEDNLRATVTVDNLAYVIYTSGSTGKPKGVQIEHKGLLNLVFWHQKAFAVSSQDRVSQIANFAFDACGWEIWPYLTAGASIYIVDEQIKQVPEYLRDWLISKAITISFLPTPLAEKVITLNWSTNTALRTILTGGDKLHEYPLVSHTFGLVNNYGPTENSVVTTSNSIFADDKANVVPAIGRPIANTQVYILDKSLQPVPVGVPGELYISSDGLARGYLNRLDLTNESFIYHEFSQELKVRLYRTGDLARYRWDGNIEFISRLDEQVKIRGHRIELGEIEAVLSQHPAVEQTVVITHENADEKRLAAYVIFTNKYLNEQDNEQLMKLQDEQVLQWQILYNEVYQQSATGFDPTLNFVGWNSSYTNQSIPLEQMSEWINNQVAQILDLQPQRVLEIGCGTGLVLFRVAPHCIQYCATDFSQFSLNYIRHQLAKQEIPQVTLHQKMADDFEGIETGIFDVVILNSVVQYFPSIDYFIHVLEGAVKATAPGGSIFIGDVRNLCLLPAFHASVQIYQAEPSLTSVELQQRTQLQIFQEEELVIDPTFFTAIKQIFPQISHVQIQLLRGKEHNELTQFRYNVILHIANDTINDNYLMLNWDKDNLTFANLRQLLLKNKPDKLYISNVPNARIIAASKIVEFLSNTETFKTVAQIRKAVQELDSLGVDPEEFFSLDVLYKVYITRSRSDIEENYDVVFVHQAETYKGTNLHNTTLSRSWQTYANNPLKAKSARKLVLQMQTYLAEKLPEYMIPSVFVVLNSLPVTVNGKVDRHLLRTLHDVIKPQSHENFIAPRNPVEQAVMKIFAEVLGLKRVGIHENFFKLGGHSLLATVFVSRVRDILSVELPLRTMFEAPTISQISQLVESLKQSKTQSKAPVLAPLPRETRRIKLSSLNESSKKLSQEQDQNSEHNSKKLDFMQNYGASPE